MQIRCQQCHKPFGLNKDQIHAALDSMSAENQQHYNAPCPHCRRLNKVARKAMLRFAPDWQKKEPAATQETPTS